jgi:hypothetical protein
MGWRQWHCSHMTGENEIVSDSPILQGWGVARELEEASTLQFWGLVGVEERHSVLPLELSFVQQWWTLMAEREDFYARRTRGKEKGSSAVVARVRVTLTSQCGSRRWFIVLQWGGRWRAIDIKAMVAKAIKCLMHTQTGAGRQRVTGGQQGDGSKRCVLEQRGRRLTDGPHPIFKFKWNPNWIHFDSLQTLASKLWKIWRKNSSDRSQAKEQIWSLKLSQIWNGILIKI